MLLLVQNGKVRNLDDYFNNINIIQNILGTWEEKTSRNQQCFMFETFRMELSLSKLYPNFRALRPFCLRNSTCVALAY